MRDIPFFVPHKYNPHFVGRSTDLETLHAALQGQSANGEGVGIIPAGVTGMGGIVRARDLVTYMQRRNRLDELNRAVQEKRPDLVRQPQELLLKLAFDYLRENRRCLLILDNVQEPETLRLPVSRDWIPAQLPVRLLFTTRRRDLGDFRPVELTVLPEKAAMELLLRHPSRQPILDEHHPEHQTARDICALLGYLPLALEIAGAHLGKRNRQPPAAYLKELQDQGAIGVLDDVRLPVTPAVHDAGVAAVLDSQFLGLESGEAQMLLRVAALFPEAAQIPAARLGLLAGIPETGESFFDVTLDQVLGELEDASLMEKLEAGLIIRLHPLVRAYAAQQKKPGFSEKPGFWCADNLAQAYEHFPTLERNCARRGIDAVQEDLLTGLDLIAPRLEARREPLGVPPWQKVTPQPTQQREEAARNLPQRLQTLLRLLQREVHNLRDWQPQAQPLRFKQQMVYRAFDLEIKEMLRQILAELRGHREQLLPTWSNKQESLALERTLRGHSNGVLAVAVTPDGRRAVSASYDQTLKVWDLATGKEERTLRGHSNGVLAVAVTPDGRRAVSASSDQTLKVWDLATGKEERTLRGHSNWVRAVAVTPDGRRAVSASYDQTLKVWDLATGEELASIVLDGSLYCVALAVDGVTIVTGDGAGNVYCLRYVAPAAQ